MIERLVSSLMWVSVGASGKRSDGSVVEVLEAGGLAVLSKIEETHRFGSSGVQSQRTNATKK